MLSIRLASTANPRTSTSSINIITAAMTIRRNGKSRSTATSASSAAVSAASLLFAGRGMHYHGGMHHHGGTGMGMTMAGMVAGTSASSSSSSGAFVSAFSTNNLPRVPRVPPTVYGDIISPSGSSRRTSTTTSTSTSTALSAADSRQLRFFAGAVASSSSPSSSSSFSSPSSPSSSSVTKSSSGNARPPVSPPIFTDVEDEVLSASLRAAKAAAAASATAGGKASSNDSAKTGSCKELSDGSDRKPAAAVKSVALATASTSSSASVTSSSVAFSNSAGIRQGASCSGTSQRDSYSDIGDTPRIDLTPEESSLFTLLTQVVDETPTMTSALRVAGGWVRDKLLATDEFHHSGDLTGHGGGRAGRAMEEGVDGSGQVIRLTRKFLSRSRGGPSLGRQGTKIIGGGSDSTTSSKAGGGDAGTNGGSFYQRSNNRPSPSTSTTGLLSTTTPVDIDIALDDMLGREFADHLNQWLSSHDRTPISVGVVLKNPEKSKHLETATMKVNNFWIDFVNLRAEEYTNSDSRIPDLMRIGSATEDAYRRDLTINALFYNISTGKVEDMTGRGFNDLRRGIIATPLPPLTTLLDDPLRVLRSVRFAARLRFAMDDELRKAASDPRVRSALALKVARERIGGEVDLMLRSPDPVGAMRLLINLRLVDTVFPVNTVIPDMNDRSELFMLGLTLLSTAHDHLVDCKISPPAWCAKSKFSRDSTASYPGAEENIPLLDDEEGRRWLWYASFLKPLHDDTKKPVQGRGRGGDGGGGREGKKGRKGGLTRKEKRSAVTRLMVDELKRPARDAEAVEKIMKAADDFTRLIKGGCDLTATAVLLSEARVWYVSSDDHPNMSGEDEVTIRCNMISPEGTREIDPVTESDPVWLHAMEYRLLISKVLNRIGPLWRAALILSLSEQLAKQNNDELLYTIEGDFMEQDLEEVRRGVIEQYDAFAASFLQLGLMGIWSQKPLIDGGEMKKVVLTRIPKGPVFREIMEEQISWMTTHPGCSKEFVVQHLQKMYPDFV